MANRPELWLLHQVGQAYSSRPSALLGIADDWLAYQADVATLQLASQVEAQMADHKLTAAQALERLAGGEPAAGGEYRDPRPMVSRRMAIPENGIW